MTDIKPDPAEDIEELREIYRSGLQEQVPPHLDEAVMRGARNEVKKDASFRWFVPWRRPAAFIATAGLSLALLIEWNESTVLEEVPFALPDTQQEFTSEAAESSARMREIGQTATHRLLGEEATIDQSASLCNDEQIATPEAWLACIAQLRADGLDAGADAEMERLLFAYPDFALAQ